MNEAIISHDGPGHRWLAARAARGVQLGLERVEAVLERMGRPQDAFASVLVAGTNGKGSTAAMTAALLDAAGLRVALYTSPHLVETRERVRIGQACVSAEALDLALCEVAAACGGLEATPDPEPTPFETLTAAAFALFRAAAVDVAVLEVGLGGRLDATNVVDPIVSVVTQVAHDHMHILGSTLAAIAAEKVCVARPGRPLVMAQPAIVMGALRRAGIDAVPVKLGRHVRVVEAHVRPSTLTTQALIAGTSLDEDLHVELGLGGTHQAENAALAVAAAEVALPLLARLLGRELPPLVELTAALADVAWPARAELIANEPLLVLDGAHNEASMKALAELLAVRGRRWQVILAVRANRDAAELIRAIAPVTDAFWVPRMRGDTLRPAAETAAIIEVAAPAKPVALGRIDKCLGTALAEAVPGNGVVLCGSLHAVGEWLQDGVVQSDRLATWLGS